MMDMKMYFHDKLPFTLLFKQWKVTSNGELGLAVFAIIVLSGLFEALRALRERLREEQCDMGTPRNDPEALSNGSRSSEIDNLVWRPPPPSRATQIKLHVAQVLSHMLQLAVGYFMMLAAMTYNSYIFGSIVFGSGLNYFIFNYILTRRRMLEKSYSVAV